MFCEDFDNFGLNPHYLMVGGRRGQGAVCFLVSRNAKLRAQLETSRSKIKDMEQQLLNRDIRIARLVKGEKPEVIYMADPNSKEMYFQCGKRHTKAMVLAMLQDALDQADGFCVIDVSEVIKAVEDL